MAVATARAIRVLQQAAVSPPKNSVPDASLPLTFFELIWLNSGPVERIFFYQHPHSTTQFIDKVFPELKSSLSLALQHFYPLAGHVRLLPGSEDQYEIYYVDGDSVSLTLAECDADFKELSGNHARDLVGLRPLVPQLPRLEETEPLLALQVTLFPEQGVSIGVAVQHVACDGSGSMHFMKSWAAACRSGGSFCPVPPNPIYERTLIVDPRGLYSIFLNHVRRFAANRDQGTDESPTQQQEEVLLLSSFTLKRDHVERLKQKVSAKATEGKAPFHCSTFVVACAHVWVCLTKTRKDCSGDKIAYFCWAADYRPRLEPPVPQEYFGNCVGACWAEAKAGDLCGEDGLAVASEAIGREIERINSKGVLKDADGWMPKYMAWIPHQPLSIAGSPKFRVYDTDFGWGKPAKVEVISITGTGAVSLAESREEPGGIEIGTAMPKPELDEFGSHFSNGLELIQECP